MSSAPQEDFTLHVNDFLKHIFGEAHGDAWVTGFDHDPASSSADGRVQAIAWGGAPWSVNGEEKIRPHHNNYLCISTFKVGGDGRVRRRSATHKATYALMIDDVGEKVPFSRVVIPPTFIVQTSPKSTQYWYALAEPVTDGKRVKATLDNLIAAGLMADNRDPGMRGVNRYGRLPFGRNTKAKYRREDGSFPEVHLVGEPNWANRVSLESFAGAFGISCVAPAVAEDNRAPAREEAEQFNLALLKALQTEGLWKEERARGLHEITCPWVHEHTASADNGTAVFEAGYLDASTGEVYNLGGFRCHHGHGEDVVLRDVLDLLRNKGHDIPRLLPPRPDPTTEFSATPVPESELLALPGPAPVSAWLASGPVFEEYEATDAANAERLSQLAGNRLRWHIDLNRWLYYTGSVWRVDDTGSGVRTLALKVGEVIGSLAAKASREQMDGAAKVLLKWASASRQKGKVDAMVLMFQNWPGVSVRTKDFDQDPCLLGVGNGVVDLRTGRLLPSSEQTMVLNNTGVAYDPEARAPDWEPFLRAVFANADGSPDDALYGYVRLFLGYCLTGLRQPELFTIFHGDGGNGKSTMLEVLEKAMGDYARHVSPGMFEQPTFAKNAGDASPELAVLPGARLVVTSESERGARLHMTLIKQLTGDVITTRHLYGETFTFTPTFKVILCTNDLPIVTGTDQGTWRRLHPVPFDRRWKRPGDTMMPRGTPIADLELGRRLHQQLPGVLAWLVEASKDYLQLGSEALSVPPARVSDDVGTYRGDSDVFGGWAEECLMVKEGARGFSLYGSYRRWCMDNGIHPMSSPMWKKSMDKRYGRTKVLDGRHYYPGVVLSEFG